MLSIVSYCFTESKNINYAVYMYKQDDNEIKMADHNRNYRTNYLSN